MSVGIVVAFEVIDIHHDHGHPWPTCERLLRNADTVADKVTAVGDAGQRIGVG